MERAKGRQAAQKVLHQIQKLPRGHKSAKNLFFRLSFNLNVLPIVQENKILTTLRMDTFLPDFGAAKNTRYQNGSGWAHPSQHDAIRLLAIYLKNDNVIDFVNGILALDLAV